MTMCRVLNVAQAGFYAWLHDPLSARDKDNQRLLTLIRDSYSLSGDVYGYRRVHGDLNEIGETCGKNRVGRIMQLNRIKAVRGYKSPHRIVGQPSVVAPNRVQRQFTVVRANNLTPSMSRRGNCWDNAVAKSFFSSLKKNASGREYTKPGIWPGRISSITLKCSITGPGVTVTSTASVRRPLNRPRREDRICLLSWDQFN